MKSEDCSFSSPLTFWMKCFSSNYKGFWHPFIRVNFAVTTNFQGTTIVYKYHINISQARLLITIWAMDFVQTKTKVMLWIINNKQIHNICILCTYLLLQLQSSNFFVVFLLLLYFFFFFAARKSFQSIERVIFI